MNEELISKAVKLKLQLAGRVLDHMPPKISSGLKCFGEAVLNSIDENVWVKDSCNSKKPSEKLNSVPIE